MTPQRIQLCRTPGWRKPPNAIVVVRGTDWGNPFPVTNNDPATAVRLHAEWITNPDAQPIRCGKKTYHPTTPEVIQTVLGGHHLCCCWCPPGQPCHADTLLKLANRG